ncbi:aldehyde dehydrogenase family protein, partial [Escherichia coli]|nr:aldehyde dehydrogenase family protein [Escherichia coli]
MSDLTLAQWQHKAAHLTLPSQAFINGSYRDAVNGATFDCINPANGKLLTKVAACDAADAELAVQAARDAFNDKRWSGLPPKQRKQIMQRFAE